MKKSKKGFTLIELLVVITIIGILAAIVIANLGDVTGAAEVEAEKATIKSFHTTMVTKKIKSFPTKGSDQLKENSTAGFAAWFRKRASFTQNDLWYVESADDVIAIVEDDDIGGLPAGSSGIAKSDGTFSNELKEDQKEAMSYCIAVPGNGASKTNLDNIKDIGPFPILWTKGLQTNGTWKGESPWGGRGGHILFNDGKIVWYEDTKGPKGKGIFTDIDTEEPTENIKDAIPDQWDILTPDGGAI